MTKKALGIFLFFAMLLTGWPPMLFGLVPASQPRIIDESYVQSKPTSVPIASAAAKTKTIVFFMGSNVSTTAVASAATTTFTFTISLPDMVPDTKPIRSAYIYYDTWLSNVAGPTASVFTLNKQGGTAQTLTSPLLSGGTTNQANQSIRLNATTAMQTLIGNASGTYAMTFTAKVTGPTRTSEGAELYITYDYDPLAATQMNTVYQSVFSTSTILGTTTFTSAAFNLSLPENTPTTTFSVGASTTNQFWVEFRGFIPGGTNVSPAIGWNAEATSSATFTQTTEEFPFLILSQSKVASTSPDVANTIKIVSSAATSIAAPNAIAIATYSYNFSASATLRKTIQLLLSQSTSTATTTAINTTTTVNITEVSPSSTNAFLFGRLALSTSSNPGIGAFMTTGACSIATTTTYTQGTASTRNAGYLTVMKDITASSSVNSAGNWNICSTFTRSTIANLPGMTLFLSYNYANNFAAGSRFATNLSFLAQSNMSPTGTTFAATGINASIANASATPSYSWLDTEWDDNSAGTVGQALTLGIGTTNNTYTFPVLSTARRQGMTFTVTSSQSFSTNVTTTIQCSVACIDDGTLNFFGYTDMVPANFTQAHYDWRLNNGSESQASSSAPEDTATTTPSSTINRLRIEVENAGDATSSANFRIEYQPSATSGAWTQLATSTIGTAAWAMATSSFVSDGTATTQIPTSTGGTDPANIFFTPLEVVASTSRNTTVTSTLTGTQFTEMEFVMKPTVNSVGSTTYYFRVSNAGTALSTYSIYPSITVQAAPYVSPVTVSSVILNNGSNIVLNPNTTTSVSVNATITDTNGCSAIASGTPQMLLYRSGITSSTCVAAPSNLDCYITTAFATSSACSANTVHTTTTFGMYYYAQATDASSTFSAQNWVATANFTDSSNATNTADAPGQDLLTMTAINVSTSSINYGAVDIGGNSGATDQTVTIQNAGNSSATVQLSGTALTLGVQAIATSSEHFATTTFTYGGNEQLLNGSPTTIPGFSLTDLTSLWSVGTQLPVAIQWAGAAAVNGYAYLISGDSSGPPTTSTYFAPINPIGGALGAWTQTQSLPVSSAYYQLAGAGYNGYVYALGGTGLTSTVLFAPVNATGSLGTWTLTTALPVAMDDFPAVPYNGYMYVIAGNGNTNKVYVAPINATGSLGTWTTTTALASSIDFVSGLADNGYLYAIGGLVSGANGTSSVLFAPINAGGLLGSWSATTPLPTPLYGTVVGLSNGNIYTVGGNISSLGVVTSSVFFAPINATGSVGSWTTTTAYPLGTLTDSEGFANNGYIYTLAGGVNSNPTSTVLYYGPQSPTGTTYWGVGLPGGIASGSYSGTLNFSAAYTP